MLYMIFFVWMRTGSNPQEQDVYRFRSHTGKEIISPPSLPPALVVFIKESNLFCFVGIPASDNANQIDAGPGPKVPEPAQQDAGARAAVWLPGERV